MFTLSQFGRGLAMISCEITGHQRVENQDGVFTMTSDSFAFAGHSYELKITDTRVNLVLQVRNMSAGKSREMYRINYHLIICVLSEIAEEDRFNQMTAFHKGEKMILKESNGLWGPVEWKNTCTSLSNYRYNGRIKPNFPSFQVVLEY